MKISKQFSFEAAHHLPHLPDGHKCKRPHGHSYIVEVIAQGRIDHRTGFTAGIDYADLSLFTKARIIDVLDHQDINAFIKPYSTAEYLAVWIWNELKPVIPALCEVGVKETASTWVRYDGND